MKEQNPEDRKTMLNLFIESMTILRDQYPKLKQSPDNPEHVEALSNETRGLILEKVDSTVKAMSEEQIRRILTVSMKVSLLRTMENLTTQYAVLDFMGKPFIESIEEAIQNPNIALGIEGEQS